MFEFIGIVAAILGIVSFFKIDPRVFLIAVGIIVGSFAFIFIAVIISMDLKVSFWWVFFTMVIITICILLGWWYVREVTGYASRGNYKYSYFEIYNVDVIYIVTVSIILISIGIVWVSN